MAVREQGQVSESLSYASVAKFRPDRASTQDRREKCNVTCGRRSLSGGCWRAICGTYRRRMQQYRHSVPCLTHEGAHHRGSFPLRQKQRLPEQKELLLRRAWRGRSAPTGLRMRSDGTGPYGEALRGALVGRGSLCLTRHALDAKGLAYMPCCLTLRTLLIKCGGKLT